MKTNTLPRFLIANGLDTDQEWIYHNENPRAIIAIHVEGDPDLDAELTARTESEETLGVVEWFDTKPDEASHKRLLADAVAFLDEFSEAAYDDDE